MGVIEQVSTCQCSYFNCEERTPQHASISSYGRWIMHKMSAKDRVENLEWAFVSRNFTLFLQSDITVTDVPRAAAFVIEARGGGMYVVPPAKCNDDIFVGLLVDLLPHLHPHPCTTSISTSTWEFHKRGHFFISVRWVVTGFIMTKIDIAFQFGKIYSVTQQLQIQHDNRTATYINWKKWIIKCSCAVLNGHEA
jgi:hypothetical protein